MSRLDRIAMVGNYLPRRCGIATFTHDLHSAIAATAPHLAASVIAMNDAGKTYEYPPVVSLAVRDDVVGDYQRAAAFLNTSRTQVVSLQHEYGIFGGDAGGHIVELISRLEMPVVTTLHTILPAPSAAQARVMRRITSISARLVVMSEKGRALLQGTYGIPPDKIDVIAHGIPEYPFIEPMKAKARLGFSDRAVVLTFGLLSPSKGLEAVIDAMPAVIAACPNAVYIVLGATHPNLVRDQGEAYREGLVARVSALGLEDHVVFLDQFVDQPTLLEFISMCDVYVTPYLNEAQMTSGTLAYSFGLGKAVVSTPYWHARELLAGGLGVLVPFGDSVAIGREVAGLLRNDVRRHAMRKRAYAASRAITWPHAATRYMASFETAIEQRRSVLPLARNAHRSRPGAPALPAFKSEYLLSMCDSTGLLQHAVHSIPDRSHGYCVDDNARALLLSATLADADAPGIPGSVTNRFAAFIQHAWNPDNGRFRNFMSYDRRWLEDTGSEDSHARTLWALAACANSDKEEPRARWADMLFREALSPVDKFSSPRSWAFVLLALDIHCRRCRCDVTADRKRSP
jgi:glycosyltransferase involved in cell wall biosynthesis